MKLKDLSINIFSGGTPSTVNEEYWNGDFYWLSSGETKNPYIRKTEKTITQLGIDKSSTRLAKVGDVVIASAGQGKTRGQVAYCLVDTYINQSIIAIRTNPILLDSKYLFYNLTSRYNELRLLSDSSSSRGSLTVKIFEDLNVSIPKLEKQKKIAKFLSNYDDLIENNNRRIKILEEMAQKIYKEWFVDFKFPGHETTTFKDSPLGKIPNDWEVKLFSDYFDIQNGFAFKSKDYSNNGVKIIRTKDFASTKYINITDPIFLPNQLKSKYETYMLQEYDFLLIMVGASIGKYGIVLKKDMPSLQNQNMWALRPKNNYIYLKNYSIFMFENLIKKVLSFATGAAREFFRKEHFNNQRIIVPNSCVLNLFNQITNDILNEISNLYTKNENLKQTRDILLPRLISGEINVGNMEVL